MPLESGMELPFRKEQRIEYFAHIAQFQRHIMKKIRKSADLPRGGYGAEKERLPGLFAGGA
jgi:hypothetical protein